MSGWAVVLPPSRPDALDLARIETVTKNVDRRSAVAVLGSTPEFRDLLYDLGFERVHVLERNHEHFERVSELRYYTSAETVVEGDWLDTLPHWQGAFAIILSDLTAGNVPYERRAEFYSLISQALAPGGFFIDKNLTNPEGLVSIGEIERRYRAAPLNLLTANYFSCEAIFCSELQRVTETVDTTAIYRALERALPDPRFQRLIADAHAITPEDCLWFYGRPWDHLAPDYCPRLQMVARHDLAADQPYFRRAFQYVWQRPE